MTQHGNEGLCRPKPDLEPDKYALPRHRQSDGVIMSKLATRVPASDHRLLTMHCLKAGTSVDAFLFGLLEPVLKKLRKSGN